nr:hypothetical protein Iba_chr13bCG2030 [Ipomoea batatas]
MRKEGRKRLWLRIFTENVTAVNGNTGIAFVKDGTFGRKNLGAFLCEAEVKMMEWLESWIYRESDEVRRGRRRGDADVDIRHVEHTCQIKGNGYSSGLGRDQNGKRKE